MVTAQDLDYRETTTVRFMNPVPYLATYIERLAVQFGLRPDQRAYGPTVRGTRSTTCW